MPRTTRHSRGRPKPNGSHGFTNQQVWAAYIAARINQEARAHTQNVEQCIRSLFGGIDDGGHLVKAKRAQWEQGMALLARAELIVTGPLQPGSDAERNERQRLTNDGNAVLQVRIDDDKVRLVTLVPKG